MPARHVAVHDLDVGEVEADLREGEFGEGLQAGALLLVAEHLLELGQDLGREEHARRGVAGGVGKGVEGDVEPLVARLLDQADRVAVPLGQVWRPTKIRWLICRRTPAARPTRRISAIAARLCGSLVRIAVKDRC